ncbi:MAG: nucleotidyltransferase substrate binding protein [Bdellovibrionales bacterium]|nr:nucleotidyltransferase substrate binding protein [Bdellovibrionales bacterium]
MSSSFFISDGIDIAPLLSTHLQFEQALKVAKSELEKAGTIQYFEFTFELAWNTLRRILKARGKDLNSPKTVLREAALEGLIDAPEIWFQFIDDRNETVHTYRRELAEQIFSRLPTFNSEVSELISKLKNLKEP